MKFLKHGGEWQLIDENAPTHACVIATLRNDLEAAALKMFCELYLDHPSINQTGSFSIDHAGNSYTVFVQARKGEKLTLRIVGTGGAETFVNTQFVI